MGDQKHVFPEPPGYYKSFTPGNIDSLSRLKREAGLHSESDSNLDVASTLEIPPELVNLVPPTPPMLSQGWHVFGEKKLLPPSDLPFLPPDPHTSLLHSLPPSPASIMNLTRAALLSFLEIVNILAHDPAPAQYFGPMWEHLRDILVNAHRAANLYRPWCAREQLIEILESYVADAHAEVSRVEELELHVDGMLTSLATTVSSPPLRSRKDSRSTNLLGSEGFPRATDGSRLRGVCLTTMPEEPSKEAMNDPGDQKAWALVDGLTTP